MISLDEERRKATKCDLCGGDPQCVKACPSAALRYVPWIDMTKEIPIRASASGFIGTQAKRESCNNCH
jgi:Fe-S-cluster-containing hydrogenase component 2